MSDTPVALGPTVKMLVGHDLDEYLKSHGINDAIDTVWMMC